VRCEGVGGTDMRCTIRGRQDMQSDTDEGGGGERELEPHMDIYVSMR
jgi:hypothetical protein